MAGGEGGGEAAGGSNGSGATSGSSTGATSGEGSGGEPVGPSGGTSGEAGATMTGDAGASGDGCALGSGNCDADPDCETDFNDTATCGGCDITCSADNGTVVCEDETCRMTGCDANYGDCNGSGVDGCETLLTNNAEHCGSCGRDCAAAGATCNTNRCSTIPLQSGLGFGNDGGGNDTFAFSPLGVLHAGRSSYAVRRMPLDNSPTQLIWDGTGATAGLMSLAVVGSDVYWAQRGAPDIVYKKAITAAATDLPMAAFYPEYQPTFLTVQGDAFFWLTGDYQAGEPAYVYTRPISAPSNVPGTRIVDVTQGTHGAIAGFAASTDAVYWITTNDGVAGNTDNELRMVPHTGGVPTSLPAVPGATDTVINQTYGRPELQTVGDTLYFNRNAGTSAINGIYRYQVGDLTPTQLVVAEDVVSFVVDDDAIYYSIQNGAGVWKAPIGGGAGQQISDGGVTKIVGHDDSFVYFIVSTCCTTAIHKAVK
jgi:hypothetical protein